MFTQKEIEITVILASGSFNGSGNTKTMKGYACAVNIEKVGLPDKNKASCGIYGINMQDMEQMTTLAFKNLETEQNLIQIKAGNKDEELSLVFKGEITSAYANFTNAPDVVFTIEALAGYFPALKAIPATTGQGSIEIVSLLEKLTGEAGYSFKNEGVTGSCNNPYYVGSPIEQIKKIAVENNIQVIIENEQVIALPDGNARSSSIATLSKDSGLLGYPTFTSDGITFKCLYTPTLELGGLVELESIVPKATGTWKITKLRHSLSANISGENIWQSEVQGIAF